MYTEHGWGGRLSGVHTGYILNILLAYALYQQEQARNSRTQNRTIARVTEVQMRFAVAVRGLLHNAVRVLDAGHYRATKYAVLLYIPRTLHGDEEEE